METTMYDDVRGRTSVVSLQVAPARGENGVKALKRSMTLDLNSSAPPGKSAKRSKLGGVNGSVLASPDLNMLKLASPELERMIIQQNGMVTTTPTPTQFICPKFVTEEQEAYARGFVDALEELHRKEGPSTTTTEEAETSDKNTVSEESKSETRTLAILQPARAGRSLPGISTVAGTTSSSDDYYTSPLVSAGYPQSYSMPQTTLRSNPSQTHVQYSRVSASNVVNTSLMNPLLNRIKEEPQIVPSTPPPPSVSPIDMESQEVHKLERKRARNRIAARKCRHRKLERISRLEDKIDGLKDQNAELSSTATKLRDQVCLLKQQILDHVKNGCQVLMSQNLTF